MSVIHLNEENFEQTIKEKSPIIVDFWASWCGPCQMLGPIFEELSGEYEGKLTFAKLSTEDAPNIAQKYGIMSIPAMLLFKNGEESDRIIGALPKSALKEKIDSLL